MMATWRSVLAAVVSCALFSYTLSAQVVVEQPRVMVLPFENQTVATNDAVAHAATATIRLTLQLLNAYQLIDPEAATSGDLLAMSDDHRAVFAEQRNVDNLVYGSVVPLDTGTGVAFLVEVFDRARNAVTVRSRSSARSVFEVFDAIDELVVEAVSGFSGIRIGFGALRIQPTGEGEYTVRVDGSNVGDNERLIERVLIGTRRIEILQRRGEDSAIIHAETVEVGERATVSISFSFPTVTAEELARESFLRQDLDRLLNLGVDSAAIAASIAELENLYLRLPGTFPRGEMELPWFLRRTTLARELTDLQHVNIEAIAALPLAERAVAVELILSDWRQIYSELDERNWREAFNVPDEEWTETQRTATQYEIRRNLTALNELAALVRTGISDPTQTTFIRAVATIEAMSSPVFVPLLRTRTGDDLPAIRYTSAYDRAIARRTPFWHMAVGAVGIVGIGVGVWQTFFHAPALRQSYAGAVSRYEDARSVDPAVAARADIVTSLNSLQLSNIVQIAGYGGGALIVSLAGLLRLNSVRRPQNIWSEYRNEPFVLRREAAALEYRARGWEAGPPRVLVLGDAAFRIESRESAAHNTPAAFTATEGDRWEIVHLTAARSQAANHSFTIQPGLNIVVLGGVE